ncbi:ribosomal-processing cysteine protease Prp [Paenibacillus eucommiae]|uniref:Ribosomal processing cysteine protease Prp n=1 Tax=Paenibacillus eucommiae TaxID=1355755 RepID=A0ABS4JAA8_9BACL|nr:ribosomal-processing cysteine protease Prp [Paenibacillus eucommiae]MBP1996789.1 uncharacterized protein YsxB (DUF464 family) [Paenibacillus eucommiae]
MIYVTLERVSPVDHSVKAFIVEGHAEYDVPGKDLVCAAVSAITVGTVNSIETLTGLLPITEMEKGLLDVTFQEWPVSDPTKASQVQLLLESMVIMLQTIHESYSDYITLETIYSKGG